MSQRSEDDWPQGKYIVYIVSSSDSHPEDDLYVSGFTAIGWYTEVRFLEPTLKKLSELWVKQARQYVGKISWRYKKFDCR